MHAFIMHKPIKYYFYCTTTLKHAKHAPFKNFIFKKPSRVTLPAMGRGWGKYLF